MHWNHSHSIDVTRLSRHSVKPCTLICPVCPQDGALLKSRSTWYFCQADAVRSDRQKSAAQNVVSGVRRVAGKRSDPARYSLLRYDSARSLPSHHRRAALVRQIHQCFTVPVWHAGRLSVSASIASSTTSVSPFVLGGGRRSAGAMLDVDPRAAAACSKGIGRNLV
jgi:hypothetical protein